jgi:excinuclease ABC subunit B
MKGAIDETNRRRRVQNQFNEEHDITPVGIKKEVRSLSDRIRSAAAAEDTAIGEDMPITALPRDEAIRLIKELESQMRRAAKELEFEKAASLRDQIVELRRISVE